MLQHLMGFFRAREDGQSLAEYALILVFIAIVAIVALTALGGTIAAVLNNVNAGL